MCRGIPMGQPVQARDLSRCVNSCDGIPGCVAIHVHFKPTEDIYWCEYFETCEVSRIEWEQYKWRVYSKPSQQDQGKPKVGIHRGSYRPSSDSKDHKYILNAPPCTTACKIVPMKLPREEMRALEVAMCTHILEKHTENNVGDLCKAKDGGYGGCPRCCTATSVPPWCVMQAAPSQRCSVTECASKFAMQRGFRIVKKKQVPRVRGEGVSSLVGIISTTVMKDARFIGTWCNDIWRQQYVRLEVLFGSSDENLLTHAKSVCTTVRQKRERNVPSVELPVVNFRYIVTKATGLYATWDELIPQSTAEFITTWNVDDSHTPTAMLKKLAAITSQPYTDAVSSGSIVQDEDGAVVDVWWNNYDKAVTHLKLADLVQTVGGKTMPNNIPHSGVMFSKSVYMSLGVGPFVTHLLPNGKEEGTLDWQLWIRWLKRGHGILHLNEAIDIYMLRHNSYGRVQAESSSILKQLNALGNMGVVPSFAERKPILVLHELYPTNTQGANMRLRQIVQWLVQNKFPVHMYTREKHWIPDAVQEAEDWAARYHVKLTADDKNLSTLKKDVAALRVPDYHAVVYGLWFWRFFAEAVPSMYDTVYSVLDDAYPTINHLVLTDDIHYIRCDAIKECKPHRHEIKRMEVATYAATTTIAITPSDKGKIDHISPGSDVRVLPMIMDKAMCPDRRPFAEATSYLRERKFILYVGNGNHMNIESVEHLLRQTQLPMLLIGSYKWIEMVAHLNFTNVRHSKGGHLHSCVPKQLASVIPGAACSHRHGRQMQTLAFKEVVDLSRLLCSARIMVAPVMMENTGISTKVFLGIEHGMHVVTTTAGGYGTGCPSPHTMCRNLHMVSLKEIETVVNSLHGVEPATWDATDTPITRRHWVDALPELFTDAN